MQRGHWRCGGRTGAISVGGEWGVLDWRYLIGQGPEACREGPGVAAGAQVVQLV